MKKLLVLLPVLVIASNAAIARREHNVMSNCTFLYSSRAKAWKKTVEAFDTLHFAPGERIADIGAKGANLEGVLSMFYDNLDMTLEDIDSSCLNNKLVDFVLRYYTALNEGREPVGIKYHVVIGNETATTLPDAAFQKVFFINTYHELTKPKQMLADLHRILASGGILYAQEKVSSKRPLRRKDCGHMMPVEADFLKAFQDAGFQLIKTNVTDHFRKQGQRVKSCWYQFRRA